MKIIYKLLFLFLLTRQMHLKTGMRLRILFILAMAICRKVMWHQAVSIC